MAEAIIYEEREPKREKKLSTSSAAALIKGLDQWKMNKSYWSRNPEWRKLKGMKKKKSSEKLSCSRRSLDAGHKNLKNTLLLLDEKFPDAVLRKWNGRPYLSSTEKLRYSAGDKTSISGIKGNDLHLHNTQIIIQFKYNCIVCAEFRGSGGLISVHEYHLSSLILQ